MECDCGLISGDVETRPSVQLDQSVPELFHNALVEEIFAAFDLREK